MKTENLTQISWINGKWSSSSNLCIPIHDRGLTLGDGIFETIAILNGKPQLLKQHLDRWQKTASLLGMEPPPSENWLKPLIKEAIKQISLEKKNGALRLNWSRGESTGRGIALPTTNQNNASKHLFWLDINHGEPSFNPISAMISHSEKRNADSRISLCKTFGYGQSIQAKLEAQNAGFEDALLVSTNGEISCGTTANLFIWRNNEWLTPRIRSGCLPGIMRQQAIKQKLVKEAKIEITPRKYDQWLLINSLSCHPITSLNKISLKAWGNPQKLWLSLINDETKSIIKN